MDVLTEYSLGIMANVIVEYSLRKETGEYFPKFLTQYESDWPKFLREMDYIQNHSTEYRILKQKFAKALQEHRFGRKYKREEIRAHLENTFNEFSSRSRLPKVLDEVLLELPENR